MRGASQDQPDPREMLEVWERQDSRAKLASMDQEAWLVLWGLLDLVDLTARRENLDHLDQQADEDPEESLDQRESLVPLAPLGFLAPLGLTGSLE